jgi:hypothetical protein
MGFTSAAASRSVEKEVTDKGKRAAAKDDRPCSRCGHLCSAHAPAEYTRMYCDVPACPCDSYFPTKSYEAVVLENLSLRKQIGELEETIEQLRLKRAG